MGVIDPDYARVFTIARIIAWQYGFSASIQGSFTRDLDLLLVPWTAAALSVTGLHLAKRIAQCTGLTVYGEPTVKPHGRLAYTLLFTGFDDPRWVDLSIFIPLPKEQPVNNSPSN